jgi:hypothetical protein
MILMASIKAGVTGEDGPDFEDGFLPAAYEKAMEPYVKNGDRAGQQVCKNLSRFIRATFLPENLSYWEEVFRSAEEVEAVEIVVTGFYFDGDSNLPEIYASATFEIASNGLIVKKGIDTLESDGETFAEAVNFYWHFEDNPYKNWDGSLVNNSGIEVIIKE